MKRTSNIFFLLLRGPRRSVNEAGVSGFMLIELIVATMIATLVAGVLLTALNMGNRFKVMIDDTIDMSERIGIVANVLEKDLMGAFIPKQAEKSSKADAISEEAIEETEEEPKQPGDKKKADKKEDDKSKEAEQKTQKKAPKPIEKIFYSTNKNNMLDTLTFTTNDPLVVFVGKDVGEVKPKAVRVQYTVRPETGKKDSYVLLRQESKELDLAEYKNVRAYEVIGGIKKITAKFIARIEKKPEKKDDKKEQEKKKIEYEYKELSEWVSEPSSAKATAGAAKKESADDKKEAEFPRIPYHIEFAITLWDAQDNKDKDFVLVYEIPVDFSPPKKQEKKQIEQQPKKDEKQNEQPGSNQQQQPQKVAQNQQVTTQETIIIETLNNTLSNLTKLLKQM